MVRKVGLTALSSDLSTAVKIVDGFASVVAVINLEAAQTHKSNLTVEATDLHSATVELHEVCFALHDDKL